MEQTDYSSLLPTEPPEGLVDWLLENGELEKHFLVYKNQWGTHPIHNRKERMEKVVCSSCQSELWAHLDRSFSYGPPDLIEIETGESIGYHCPRCGIKAETVHSRKLGSAQNTIQSYPITVENVDHHLAIICWCVEKIFLKDGTFVVTSNPYEAYVTESKKLVRLKGWTGTLYGQHPKLTGKWQQLKTFSDSLGYVDLVYPWDPNLLEYTNMKHCKLDIYLSSCERTHPVQYLKLFLKQPNVENLITQGAGYLIEEFFSQNTRMVDRSVRKLGLEHIAWKEARPAQMLGLEKEDFKTVVSHKWNAEKIFIYSLLKKHGIHPTPEQIELCQKEFGSNNVSELLQKGLNPTTVANYLQKQKSKDKRNDFVMLRDYWRMAEALNLDLGLADVRLPSRLHSAHDRVMELYKQLTIRINEEKMAECFRKREYFSWENENIMIRPVKSSDELKEEGSVLHHCVYSYSKKVEQGQTSIFFIRRKKEPDKPWFTLEFDVEHLKVKQNKGTYNCAPPEEVNIFVKEWLKHIKEGEKKQKSKQKKKRGNAA